MISLDSGVFGEAVPMQDLFDLILDRPVHLICQQDNAAVIQIVHGGYSAKLRHMRKIRKLNLSALYELFRDPAITLCNISKQHCSERIRSLRHLSPANG